MHVESEFKYLDAEFRAHIATAVRAILRNRPQNQIEFMCNFLEHRAKSFIGVDDRFDERSAMKDVDNELNRVLALARLSSLPDVFVSQNLSIDANFPLMLSGILCSTLPGSVGHSYDHNPSESTEALLVKASPDLGAIAKEISDMLENSSEVSLDGFRFMISDHGHGAVIIIKLEISKCSHIIIVDATKVGPDIYTRNYKAMLIETLGRIQRLV